MTELQKEWKQGYDPMPPGVEVDVLLPDGSILCGCLLQSDGDIWWGGAGTGEKFIDPVFVNIQWRLS